ncbi:hypothetical protein A2300_02285 [Candidatus Falkowbacteria bacterium RIFOXYB2_FULL_35_7]|nr:MAG: hypothetical protein A2300_02285 [Candidatus Falkowbacteria bacterium RIFOXYB2_FULL_35_7]
MAENGVIGFAIDLISFDSKFRKVYEQIFGSTIVVDKVEHAREVGIGRERMVTLGGDIFEKSGMIRGGFRVSGKSSWFMTENNGKIVSQEEKLKEIAILKSKIEDLTKEKVDLLTETNNLRVELQVDDTKQKALRNDLEDLIKERDNLGREISDNEIDPKDKDRLVTQLQARRREIENKVNAVEEIIVGVRSKIDKFNLDEEKKKEEVFRLQDEMQSAQSKLNEISREVNEIKIELAKLDTREEDLVKEVLHELGENKKIEELKIEGEVNSDQLWFDINKLKQSLEMIGGIDPEVVDEHKEVSGRYEFLSKQTDDLEKAIRNLGKIVEELDAVIGKQFNASFNKINKSFEQYFKKIFQGGKAKLTLLQKEKIGKDDEEQTEAEQALIEGQENEAEETVKKEKAIFTQTGIDLYVSPPNKKLNTISALSGGERTMTSLALLCAIIDSNPAPFVVMDEVDAALDEANSERFAAIIEEIAYKTQFVFITHNRIIMHVADVLYGVAMGEDGVSKTLSLDMKDAEKQARE